MANHVERMLGTLEHHTCGRCGWVLPSHGAYVMHDCAGLLEMLPDDRAPVARFLMPRWQAPCWLGNLTPIPVRLVEALAAERAMGLRRPARFVVPDRLTMAIYRDPDPHVMSGPPRDRPITRRGPGPRHPPFWRGGPHS
jgi:hypothetical protein